MMQGEKEASNTPTWLSASSLRPLSEPVRCGTRLSCARAIGIPIGATVLAPVPGAPPAPFPMTKPRDASGGIDATDATDGCGVGCEEKGLSQAKAKKLMPRMRQTAAR